MNKDQFWIIIDTAKQKSKGDMDTQLKIIQTQLETFPPNDILDFQHIFDQLFCVSYRAGLWDAAVIMQNGYSNEEFDYFRGWIILQGKTIFETALENPDSLAMAAPEGQYADFAYRNEDILNIACILWHKITGLETDGQYTSRTLQLPDLDEFLCGDSAHSIDAVRGKKLYPRLWKQFYTDDI